MKRRIARVFLISAMLAPLLQASGNTRSLANQIPKPVATGSAHALGRPPASDHLDAAIGLPLRDPAGLKTFIDTLYDPTSPSYKHYLTPDQFTSQFGPSAADYQKVVDFLKSSGFTVKSTTPNRMIVDVGGAVSDFERVFHFKMRTYQHPSEPRTFHAPDVEPSVPLDVPILDIMGLDDYTLPHRMDAKPDPSKPHANITGSGFNGSFLAKDLQTAYTPGVTLTGAGQSIGLFELGPYSPADITEYEQIDGLPNVPLVNVLLNGVTGAWTPAYGDGEESLDIEMAIALAPGVSQVIVYEGTVEADIMNRMATDNAARQLSCSWGFGSFATLQQILMEYAAQGQSFLHSSGDGGTWTTPVNAPGGNPYTTEVGGTTLVTNGPGGAWLSETTWKGSGGGFDTSYPIPSYQSPISMTANMGSTVYRNFPDLSIVGDGIIFNISASHLQIGGGTSASAPLWAAFVALANQQAAATQKAPVGFLNPTIYTIGQGSRYNLDFHDITTGNNTNAASPNLYYAVPGFDLTTGWGTPAGQNMINDLVGTAAGSPGFNLSVTPYQVNVTQGASSTTSVAISPYGGFTGSATLAVSGLPGGVVATFAPSTTAANSTISVAVPAALAVGVYTGTITAASGALKQSIAFTVSVTAPVTPDFTLSASPSIVNVIPGSSIQTAVVIGPVGTFSSPVTLSVAGSPAGLTSSFSALSSNNTSTLTLNAGTQVTPGIYILTVSGSSGTLTRSSTLGLLVRASALSPEAVDMTAIYNETGIATDGTTFVAGIGKCCAYSANLLGKSFTMGNLPFIFGPLTNGLLPARNAISGGSSTNTVPLPSGAFGYFELLASGKGGNQLAQVFTTTYLDGTTDTFTQDVSDWNTPQNYPGEAIAAINSYSDTDSGGKDTTGAYLYKYQFGLNNCRTVASFTLPQNGGLNTLAMTLVPTSAPCTATTINSVNVVSGATSISQNSWIEIHGSNLAPSTVPAAGMTWSNAPDFAQGKMPTQLSTVGVTVNGNPAYVYYISQSQIDVLTPLDTKISSSIPVVVTVGSNVSSAFNVAKAAVSPAFALAGATKYLAATHATGTYVGPSSLGAGFTPAAPGEEIVLYGFGFGLPSTALVAGSSTQSGSLASLPTIQIGGKTAQVLFAGLISPGLYQFNVVVPANAPAGDNAVTATYNQVAISTAGFISVN